MDLGLKDKIALVVASSSGLGFAAAVELAREGAKVVVCGRNQERVETAVSQIRTTLGENVTVSGTTGDVSQAADCAALVQTAVDTYGGLDILVTNAGGPPKGLFEKMDTQAWDTAYRLTLMSVTHLIQAALPHLKKSDAASILTVTSISAKEPIAGLLLSNVFRPAVIGLTKTLSQEHAADGIRVNSILPGWTATDRVNYLFNARAEQNGTDMETERQRVADSIPMKRMADPAEFGRAVAFLSSPAASYITGTMIQVDGGNTSGLL